MTTGKLFTTLMGGLGNQLCTYLAALTIAKQLDKQVVCSLEFLNAHSVEGTGITPRKYQLDQLAIPPETVERIPSGVTDLGWEPSLKHLPPVVLGDCMVSGYFQALEWLPPWRECDEVIWGDGESDNWPTKLSISHTYGAIALHVRRTDYVTNPSATAYHGVLPVEYYQRAVAKVWELDPNISRDIAIYSDDVPWCKEHLAPKLEGEVYFPGEVNTNALHDLLDISLYPYIVMANSSFSWLAAYLGGDKKSVIYPLAWTTNGGPRAGMMKPEWIGL